MKKVLRNFLWVLIMLGSTAYAQTRTVTGVVTGKEDGLPLPGVSVMVKGTKIGTQTGGDGSYSIKVPAGSQTLVFSFIGFTSQSHLVSGNRLNVTLSGANNALNEVVVIGYGTQVKRDVNGSITSIKGAEIAQQPVQNIQQALGGRAAGVQVTMPNGLLNQNPVIRIRGANSIALSSQPLYVVDGVPSFEGNQNGGTAAAGSPLGNINPEDIESLQIAKDASETAIYGSRGANGVIFITTKKGKKGKAVVSLDSWIGESKVTNLPKLLNAQQYTDIKNEALVNARLYNAAGTYFATTPGVDTRWYDYIYRTGVAYNSTASISGGTDNTSYYVSSNWTKQNGILNKNSFERKSMLANIDHRVNNIISLGGKLSYSNTLNKAATSSGSQEGEAFGITGLGRIGLVSPPNVGPYNADGSYNLNANTLGIGNNKGVSFSYYNILPIIDLNRSNNELNQVNSNVYFQVKPLPWLTLKTQYGVDYLMRNVDSFQNPFQGDGINLASATDTYYSNKRWVWDNTLSIDKVFGKHTINATFGNEQDRRTTRGFGINRTGISDVGFNVIQAGYSTNATSGMAYGDYYLVSLFGRFNYDFDKKYSIGGVIRQDQYSVFGANKKKGNFPSVNAGWEITREKFWSALGADKVFSSFKIRGSWGKLGNASNFGAYDSYGLYANGLYNGSATLVFNQTGNSDLGWESIAKLDLGFNWGILGDRITGEVAYYKNNIDNLIFNVPTIPSAGLPTNPPVNIGSMYNKGLEFSVSAQAVRTKDFSWNSNFNISVNQNRITSIIPSVLRLTNSTSGSETVNINEVGHSVGSLYIIRTGGIDPTTGRRIFIDGQGRKVYYQNVIPTTGGYNWEYADGSRAPAITQSDASINYANTAPKFQGGFDNTFRYKNFDLNVLMTYQLGFHIYYGTNAGLHDQRFWNNATDILTDRWTTPGQAGAKYAKVVYGDNVSNGSSLPLDINVFKGDFLKVKSVNFGYSLPKSLLSRVGISNMRVYVAGYNLLTVTSYPGSDPEVSANGTNNSTQGIDRNTAGSARTVTAGFSIKF